MTVGNGGVVQDDSGSAGNNGGEGRPQFKKGTWDATEDEVLIDYVMNNGEGNWNAVHMITGLARCGKSCRDRWVQHLRPNLKKRALSPEEERTIVELHAYLGNKWAHIAALLPGRTDDEIKAYWKSRIKIRQRQGLPLYPPHIQPLHQNHTDQNQHPAHSKRTTPIPSTPITPTSFSFQTPPAPLHNPTPISRPSPLHKPNQATPILLPLFDTNEGKFSSSVLKPKEETTEQNQTVVDEDLSKLFSLCPSSMQVPQWYSESGEASNGQSSVVTDDNIRVGDAPHSFFISSGHQK